MDFNTLAPALMENCLQKKIKTPFGIVTFTHHKPYKDCLWIYMSRFQTCEMDVDTYITASNLKNNGLMLTVRRKSGSAGPKQETYEVIEKIMNFLIKENDLEIFDKNKYPS